MRKGIRIHGSYMKLQALEGELTKDKVKICNHISEHFSDLYIAGRYNRSLTFFQKKMVININKRTPRKRDTRSNESQKKKKTRRTMLHKQKKSKEKKRKSVKNSHYLRKS